MICEDCGCKMETTVYGGKVHYYCPCCFIEITSEESEPPTPPKRDDDLLAYIEQARLAGVLF